MKDLHIKTTMAKLVEAGDTEVFKNDSSNSIHSLFSITSKKELLRGKIFWCGRLFVKSICDSLRERMKYLKFRTALGLGFSS